MIHFLYQCVASRFSVWLAGYASDGSATAFFQLKKKDQSLARLANHATLIITIALLMTCVSNAQTTAPSASNSTTPAHEAVALKFDDLVLVAPPSPPEASNAATQPAAATAGAVTITPPRSRRTPRPTVSDECIPPATRALDGQAVMLDGFMIPLDYLKGETENFAVIQTPVGCFYCNPPRVDQLVMVQMPKGQKAAITDQPIRVTGLFSAGVRKSDDIVESVYRIDAKNVSRLKTP